MTRHIELSILIKAFNEEGKIGAAIRSAQQAAERTGLQYEVIVADSCSTDRTVGIALAAGARLVRFVRAQDRGCGAGVQLGYQFARGEWVYLMDGDMTLHPDFLVAALAHLRASPDLAGVAGRLEDTRLRNAVDRIRAKNALSARTGEQNWLNAGGLYRREAIRSAGDFAADRNLRAYEEAELGMRLRSAGWRLERIDAPAISHTGHDLGTWALLWRHWRSRRAMAAGVLLKSAIGQPWRGAAVRLLAHPLAVLAFWALVAAAVMVWGAGAAVVGVGVGLAGWLLLALRKGDLRHATVSVIHWHYAAVAILYGLCIPLRGDPAQGVEAEEVHPERGSAAA